MTNALPSSPGWRALIDRLRHLLVIEGYGRSTGKLGVVVAARSLRALVSLGPPAIVPLLAALPELERYETWPALRARIEASEGDRRLDALDPAFTEPLLDARAEPTARARQLLRRLRYLVEREFVDAPISSVMFSGAAHELRRLDYEAAWIEAFLDSDDPGERRLVRFMLRGVTQDWSRGDDRWWLARVADHLEEFPAAIAAASPAQLHRFESIGLIPADFAERTTPPSREYLVGAIPYLVCKHPAVRRGRSVEVGCDLHRGEPVVVTTLPVLSDEPLPPRARLVLDYEGVSPLVWSGRVERDAGLANVVVEALPRLARSDRLGPLAPTELARLADATACVLARVHAGGECLVGLRPELTLVDALGRVTVAPRGDLLRLLTWPLGPRVEGQETPFDDLYVAPELLMGSEPPPASDVFSLCAAIVRWSTGEHPFVRPTPAAQVQAMLSATPDCEGVPGPLRSLVVAGLRPGPGSRPSLADLRAALRRS